MQYSVIGKANQTVRSPINGKRRKKRQLIENLALSYTKRFLNVKINSYRNLIKLI